MEIKLKYNILAIFAVLTALYSGPMLTGNEEHYMGLAKQFMDYSWLPGSFSFNEFPGARLLYQIIAGSMLHVMSFEATLLIGETLVIAASAVALGKILYTYRLGWIHAIAMLATYTAGQSFLGGHNMFTGFEAKHIAYIFNLLMILQIIKGRTLGATMMAIIATYFHFLVGAWAAFYLLALIAYRRDWLGLRWNAVLYASAVLPLALYLSAYIDPVGSEVSYIYTHIRNPHHTLAFTGWKPFINNHLPGFLASIAAGYFLLNRNSGGIGTYAGLIFMGTALFFIIAMFDANGVITKYLPFRISNVAVLILLLELSRWLRWRIYHNRTSVLIASSALLCLPVMHNIYNQYRYLQPDGNLQTVAQMAQAYTPEGSVFLDLTGTGEGLGSDGQLYLERMLHRPMYVQYKFVPAGTSKILEWKERIEKRELAKRTGLIPSGVDYVIAIDRKGSYYIVSADDYAMRSFVN